MSTLVTVSAMPVHSASFELRTNGKGTYNITENVEASVDASQIQAGTVTVFVQHTSCSLVLMENADRTAREDLHEFFERLVPEDSDYLEHTSEGPDDSTSHIRMVLTRSSEVIPVAKGRMQLGTWQGIFVFEHRRAPHRRRVVVTVVGE
jgi:secondary thiamine-phosphate synthase enzyme